MQIDRLVWGPWSWRLQAWFMATGIMMIPGVSVGKNLPANTGDAKRQGFDPWVRKISWRRNGNPLQYSSLENFMERGAWLATVHGFTKSQTWLSNWAHMLLWSFWHRRPEVHTLGMKQEAGVMGTEKSETHSCPLPRSLYSHTSALMCISWNSITEQSSIPVQLKVLPPLYQKRAN